MDLTPSKTILALCTVASAAGLLAGLGGTGLTIRELLLGNTVAQSWFFLGSQVLMTVSAVFGLLAGLNRFGGGPALAMVIAGGGAVTAGALGEPLLVGRFIGISGSPMVMLGVRSTHVALLEIGVGVALAALGAVTVLARRPRESVRYLAMGAGLLAPVVLAGAVFMVPPVRSAVLGVNPVLGTVLAVAAFLVLSALFASGVHCVIRAFEVGCPALPSPPGAEKKPAKKGSGASGSKTGKPVPGKSGGKDAPKAARREPAAAGGAGHGGA